MAKKSAMAFCSVGPDVTALSAMARVSVTTLSLDGAHARSALAPERNGRVCPFSRLTFKELQETCDDDNVDPVGVMFALFVHSIHCLVVSGWSIDELLKEVKDHGNMEVMGQSFEQ